MKHQGTNFHLVHVAAARLPWAEWCDVLPTVESAPVVVWQMRPVWGLASPSPFCLKLETWLRLAKIPHRVQSLTGPPRSSTGKIPYIERGDGSFLSDSNVIIETLTREWAVKLDANLSAEQYARGLLLRRLFEEDLYWVIVYERWVRAAGWKLTKPGYFGSLPPVVRDLLPSLIRRKVIRDARGQGLARLPHTRIVEHAAQDLTALESMLGERAFFLGDQPTSIDATAYGFLANMLLAPVPSETKVHLESLPGLVSYIARVQALAYRNAT